MEQNRHDSYISVFKKTYENTLEQSIDTDFTLPDYYPEITKILKCLQEISILSKQCSDGKLNIGGQVVLTLMYVGSDEQINSFTHTYPFSKSVDVDNADGELVNVMPKIAYLNTKAVAPRKVEIHGSASLNVTVSKIEKIWVVASDDSEGVYSRKEDITASIPVGVVKKSTFIDDEINIPQTKPTIGKILRYWARPVISECKNVSGKTVIKGDVDIDLLYCPSDSKKPILITERKGFSQIVDSVNDGEECCFISKVKVDSIELRPKTSLDGEVRTVNFEVKLSLELICYENVTQTVITDAFTTKYQADIKQCEIKIENLVDEISENFVCKKTFDFSGGLLSEVYDTWCDAVVEHTAFDGNNMLISGNVNVHILGTDNDGQPVYFERSLDCEYKAELDNKFDEYCCCPEITVAAVNCSLNGDAGVDISVELSVKAKVIAIKSINAVTSITVDIDDMLQQDNNAAIVLYFAENESVWSIAQKYKTSPEIICKSNAIDDFDEVCKRMIIVPKV